MLFDQSDELLLRHAVPEIGSDHRHQRGPAARQLVLEYRLPITPSLPDDVLYFHAQYRQSAPNNDWKTNGEANRLLNTDGKSPGDVRSALTDFFRETRMTGLPH